MKNIIFILILSLVGCTKSITVPIDSRPLSAEKSTLIIFSDDRFANPFTVVMDDEPLSEVSRRRHIKIEIKPGQHDLYVRRAFGFPIRRKLTKTFEKGEVYFLKIRYEYGLWVGSLWIEPIDKIDSYEAIIY